MENPLSRGGHTQVAAFGAFSKTGGPCLVEKVGGETVGRNPLSRGGHTHRSPASALFRRACEKTK